MSVVPEKKFVIKQVFTDIMKMRKNGSTLDKQATHFNLPWKMTLYRSLDHFNIYLECLPYSKSKTKWSMETEVEFKLFNENMQKLDVLKYVRTENISIFYLGFFKFRQNRILKYLADGNLSIECHVRIIKMTGKFKQNLRNFDKPIKNLTDVVLIVNDEKFHVSRALLATHSPYFNTLFFENASESGQSEITLNDVDPQNFQDFLELIHGETPIDDNSVFGILQLADMFDTKNAMKRCEEFLIKESEYSLENKFHASVTHKMETLAAKCISEMKTRDDIWSVMPGNAYQIDPSTWKKLLRHALDSFFLTKMARPLRGSPYSKKAGIRRQLRSFDESMKEFSDIVLIVDNEKFYVLKTYLACHSSYFNSLFNRNFHESQQSEITLNDIDPKDFQRFLELIYGESAIDDNTIQGILKLADMYDSQTAIRRCEEFLIKESKKEMKVKFDLAVQYKMDELKEKCLSEMETPDDIWSVVPEDANQVDPPTWMELLYCALDLHS